MDYEFQGIIVVENVMKLCAFEFQWSICGIKHMTRRYLVEIDEMKEIWSFRVRTVAGKLWDLPKTRCIAWRYSGCRQRPT
ncbi:hypothetical protein DEO72_LG4g1155 [Vigna unguiculata]|uniref:Uncharacterized protein n=1 Tax=Vigna unguiculata TaxID=3917 RepID=A0A4D6LNW9_VIGUN|nr:hypothetical protein DEO72_LG4g1155 [Vigna unguiculata]